jgi:gluconate 2-dehydrogenase gamma chain
MRSRGGLRGYKTDLRGWLAPSTLRLRGAEWNLKPSTALAEHLRVATWINAVLRFNRRQLLGSSAMALLVLSSRAARAAIISGGLPWTPGSADPPAAGTPGGWKYFTPQEASTVEALADRLIPPDPETPGGKDCGCAVYIDRQLAGPYGRYDGYYMSGPFQEGTKQQGPQSSVAPAQQYRKGLASLDAACRSKFGGKMFTELADDQRDDVIKGLEDGSLKLDGADSKKFFELILKDTQKGFLADPIYGGNKDMASWKMIGFPGARYDYRDWIDRHNQRIALPPVGISNHPNWPQ